MRTTVLHNHHICWTICPSRKLVHPRSSKGICINCLELIATNNFLRGPASSPEVTQLMLLQHGVQTENSCWKKDAGMALFLYCQPPWQCDSAHSQVTKQWFRQYGWEVLQHLPHGPDPVFSNLSVFCSSKVWEWWVWFCTLYVDFFCWSFWCTGSCWSRCLSRGTIMLKSSVHSCVCVCVNKVWS